EELPSWCTRISIDWRKAAGVEPTGMRLTPPPGFEARPHRRVRLPSKARSRPRFPHAARARRPDLGKPADHRLSLNKSRTTCKPLPRRTCLRNTSRTRTSCSLTVTAAHATGNELRVGLEMAPSPRFATLMNAHSSQYDSRM